MPFSGLDEQRSPLSTQVTQAKPIHRPRNGDRCWRLRHLIVSCIFVFGISTVGHAASSPSVLDEQKILPRQERERTQTSQPIEMSSRPGRRAAAGHRCGGWFSGTRPTVLVPESSTGLTSAEYPTFYFYVPPEVRGMEAKLLLVNEAGDFVSDRAIALPLEEGIMGVSLTALEVGEVYEWYLSIVPRPDDPSANLVMYGSIQRIALNDHVQRQLDVLPPGDRAWLYNDWGLWFDAVNSLAQQRMQDPNNPQWQEQWNDLLLSVDLEAIAPQSILGIFSSNERISASSFDSDATLPSDFNTAEIIPIMGLLGDRAILSQMSPTSLERGFSPNAFSQFVGKDPEGDRLLEEDKLNWTLVCL
ncbi:MAG: DUF928 domain-containing protein [Cyanobacteria bacterium J06638_20]